VISSDSRLRETAWASFIVLTYSYSQRRLPPRVYRRQKVTLAGYSARGDAGLYLRVPLWRT
jgi:hypothetical protein